MLNFLFCGMLSRGCCQNRARCCVRFVALTKKEGNTVSKSSDDEKKSPRWLNESLEPAERLEQWLGTQGYPLEFQTAAAFRDLDFSVAQGVHLTDAKAGKALEVDVMASMQTGQISVEFLVECKVAPNPWVVLAAQPPGLSRHLGHSLNAKAEDVACVLSARGEMPPGWVAWGMPTGFTAKVLPKSDAKPQNDEEAQDAAYRALSGVASRLRLRHVDGAWLKSDGPCVTIPMVVIKGREKGYLHIARLGEDGKRMVVEKAERVRIVWQGSPASGERIYSAIDLVEFDSLKQHLLAELGYLRPLLVQMEIVDVGLEGVRREGNFSDLNLSPDTVLTPGLIKLRKSADTSESIRRQREALENWPGRKIEL